MYATFGIMRLLSIPNFRSTRLKLTIIKSLILLLLNSLVLESCNSNEICTCDDYILIPEGMKEYSEFTEGDYWIYKLESDTTIIDTITCTYFSLENNGCSRGDVVERNADPCSHVSYTRLQHSNVDFFPNLNPASENAGSEMIRIMLAGEYSYEVTRDVIGATEHGELFVYPSIDPSELYTSVSYQAEQLDSFIINDSIYKKVIQSTYLFQPQIGGLDSLFIAPEVGILSYKTSNTEKWILHEYNLQ